MDWSLRGCSRQGHATYAPTEPELNQRLQVQTSVGEAWRCLRCGDFVVGEPAGAGPAGEAPLVLRGKVLREAFILRLLAVERLIRGIVVALLAYAVIRFESSQTSLQALFEKALPRAKPLADLFNYDLDKSATVAQLRHFLHSRPSTLHIVAGFLIGYAVIELVEAVGLWSLTRWGEYVAAVATSAFLPIEVYELTKNVTWLKVAAFAVNILLVVYLVIAKRLFGVRGGRSAFEQHRRGTSLLEVEAAAAQADLDGGEPHRPVARSGATGLE